VLAEGEKDVWHDREDTHCRGLIPPRRESARDSTIAHVSRSNVMPGTSVPSRRNTSAAALWGPTSSSR
jgi:hypothetical protein